MPHLLSKRTLLVPWFKYKQTLVFKDEQQESFEWIYPLTLRNLLNAIRDILDKKPYLREKIRSYIGNNIIDDLEIANDFIPHISYNEYVLERALLSYRSLLDNWKLWTKIFKENMAKYVYLQKQLSQDTIVRLYTEISNPNSKLKYNAEQYNMDVETYKKTLTDVYDEIKYISSLDYYSKTTFTTMPNTHVFPGYIRRETRKNIPFTFDIE
jgi:tRNA-dihydrouridine synthase